MAAAKKVRNIILVGLMGSGKSTVARIIGKKLGWQVCDLDRLITEKAGITIRDLCRKRRGIFPPFGEGTAGYGLTAGEHLVVATGGGAVIDEENRRVMKENGTMVYLQAEIKDLCRRLGRKGRPLLARGEPEEILAQLAREREAFYREAQGDCGYRADGSRCQAGYYRSFSGCREKGF